MSAMVSQITSLNIVYSTVYSGADQRKHQSSAPLAFVRGIHRRPVNSSHKWPVMRKMFPFDDVIMDFMFDNQWFLQNFWHCHGQKYAPSFANTFMANLEDIILRKAKCKPLLMSSFIDDIFFIWSHSKDELTEFINLFNRHNESIKIDCNINEASVDFFGRHNFQRL